MNNLIYRSVRSSKKTVVLLTAAALVVSGFFVASVAFAAHTATVTLDKPNIQTGTATYAFTVTNSGSDAIRYIKITAPTTPTSPASFIINDSLVCPADWGSASNVAYITCTADEALENYLMNGNSVQISLSAISPAVNGIYTWEVKTRDVLSIWDTKNPTTIVDNTPPNNSSITVSSPLISDILAGTNFTVTANYDESMNQAVNPIIAFTSDVLSTLTFSTGSWIDADTYVATYAIVDAGVSVSNIGINVTGAKDLAGNTQASGSLPGTFSIDTQNPIATNATAVPVLAKAGDVVVTIVFSEGMNSTNPTLGFTGITGSMTTKNNGTWSSANTWTETFTLSDANEIALATISVAGAVDSVGNLMSANNNAGSFNVDTIDPAISPANIIGTTIQGYNDTITITFSEPVIANDGTWSENEFSTIEMNDVALNLAGAAFNYSGNALTITLGNSANLKNGRIIAVTPAINTIKDTAGNFLANTEVLGTGPISGDVSNPTVNLTYNPDKIVRDVDVVTITATFNEVLDGTPQIAVDTIGIDVETINMTASGNSLVWTYIWEVPAGSDGMATITITAIDLAGNTNAVASNYTRTIDNTSPTVISLVKDHFDLIVRDIDTVLITATFDEAMTSNPTITIVGSDIAGASMINTSGNIWTHSWNVPSEHDGAATVTIAGADLAGNSYVGDATLIFTIDNIAPTPVREAHPVVTPTKDTTPDVGILIETGADWTIKNGGIELISGTGTGVEQTVTLPTLTDNTYSLTLIATDVAGNQTSISLIPFLVDATAPTVNAGADVRSKAEFTQTGTASDISGIATHAWSKVSGPAGTLTFGSAAAAVTTISATIDGTYIVRLTATDIAGNSDYDEFTLIWDTTAPTVILTNNPADLIVRDTDTVIITATFNEDMTSAPTITIGTLVTTAPTSGSGTTWIYSWEVPAGNDGSVSATVAGTDLAGNAYVVMDNLTFTIDNIVPNAPEITSPTDRVYKAALNQPGNIDLTFTASDQAPGTALQYAYNLDNGGYNAPANYITGANPTTVTVSGLSDGRHTLQLKIVDAAGNFIESGVITFVIDNNNTLTVDDTSTDNPDFATIQAAINAAATTGDTIEVAAGTYAEVGQIVISKNLSIVGAGIDSTTLKTTADKGSDGDSRGWFLVNADVTFDISYLTLDGTGYKIWQGIRDKGNGTIDNVKFANIRYNESGPTYQGTAVVAFGGNVDVTNCEFSGIGRVGVLYYGTGITDSQYNNNHYTGKGAGNWLDYAVELGAGAQATISNNVISNCKGVATVDNSTSAGIAVTTYFGAGTQATITGNTISDSTDGIGVGYDVSDTSIVIAHGNILTGNGKGINSTHPVVNGTQNYWGTAVKSTIQGNIEGNVTFEPYYVNSVGGILSNVKPTVISVDDDYLTTVAVPESYYFGYNAFKTIQEGISAVAENGTVNVAAGLYQERIVINKSLTLLGATKDVSKKNYVVPTDYAYDPNVESIIKPATDAQVPVIDVEKLGGGNIVGPITIKGFVLTDQGVSTFGTDAHRGLINLNISTGLPDGILIENNVIGPHTGPSQNGLMGRGGIASEGPSNKSRANMVIKDNLIFGNLGDGVGIMLVGAYLAQGSTQDYSGSQIENNTISGNTRSGIEIAGGVNGSVTTPFVITNNTIKDNGWKIAYGLLDYATKLKYGNGINFIRGGGETDNQNSEIYPSFSPNPKYPFSSPTYVNITGNEIINNEKNGIYMGPMPQHITITGNTIQSNGTGGGSYQTWDGIRIDLEESYYGVPGAGSRPYTLPLVLDKFSDNVFNSNTIAGNGSKGVKVINTSTLGPVAATKNWWNTTDGNIIASLVSGNVNYRPWRTSANLTYTVDTTNPLTTISSTASSPTNNSPILFSVLFNEAVNDFTATDIAVTHGTASEPVGSNDAYTFSVTPSANYQGDITVKILANAVWDESGNYNTESNILTKNYDNESPTLSTVTMASNNANTALAIVGNTVTITIVSSENIQAPTVTMTIAGHPATVSGANKNWAASYQMAEVDSEGTVAFSINFTDLAGNNGTAVTVVTSGSSVTFDKTAPVVAISAPIDGTKVNGDAVITFADGETIPAAKCSINALAPISCTSGVTKLSNLTGFENLGQVGFTLYLRDTDAAGNIGTDNALLTKDTVSPIVLSHVPTINAMNVEPANDIVITFREAVVVKIGNITFAPAITDGFAVENSETDVVTINPTNPLKSNTNYTITLSGVTDLAGNVMANYGNVKFTTATYYNISLYFTATGWNLVSLPVVPNETAIETVLGNASTSIEEIWTYAPNHPGADVSGWLMYAPGDPTETNNLDEMTTGYGYWISVTGNTNIEGWGNLLTAGHTVPPSRTLDRGWNLIGYYQIPGEDFSTPSQAFKSLQSAYTGLWGYDNQGGGYKSTVSEILPGDAFWISLTSEEEYTPSNL